MKRRLILVVVAALAVGAVAATPAAIAQTLGEAPQMQIGPPTVHVKNGRITVKAVCPPEVSSCEGVIVARLPITRRPGSLLDAGGLGGRIFSMKPGETRGFVFPLTSKAKAFLKTHVQTTLNLTVKVLDDERNESVTKLKLTLFRV
jgi:hypothetical protein